MDYLFNNEVINKLVSVLCRTFIHSLWQCLLIACIAALFLQCSARMTAVRRYQFLLTHFILMILCSVLTFCWQWNDTASLATEGFYTITKQINAFLPGNSQYFVQVSNSIRIFIVVHERMIFYCWLVLFSFKLLQLSGAFLYTQRVRKNKIYTPGRSLEKSFSVLIQKTGIKRAVRLLESGYCKVPAVIGHFKPIILLPVGIAMNIPAEQVEAILLHELAHIRRNDYMVNMLQNIAGTIFFFNPFLLWLSSRIREERENCCDDIALAHTQNRRSLAEALIGFREYELYGSAFTTAFPGRKNFLLQRVRRILLNRNNNLAIGEKLFFIPAVTILFIVIILATSVPAGNHKIMPHVIYFKNNNVASSIVIERSEISFTDQKIQPKKEIASITGAVNADRKQKAAEHYKEQAEREKLQLDEIEAQEHSIHSPEYEASINDEKTAMIDQKTALKDMMQAKIDQEQGFKDQLKAKLDYEQEMKNILLYKADAARADVERQELKRKKLEAEKLKNN